MIINALNSGANVFMADFEDATSPTWANIVERPGQPDGRRAADHHLREPDAGKRYALKPPLATLMVRPRGFHLPEQHFVVDGRPAPGMLFDFGLYLFHNAAALREAGTGPYFYLPKMQSHLEARLWNDVFVHAQSGAEDPASARSRSPCSSKRCRRRSRWTRSSTSCAITSPASTAAAGTTSSARSRRCRTTRRSSLPDRGQVTMEAPFLRAYTQLLIKTCHRRGAFAMGGMAAQIPIKDDPDANARAMEKVRADKLREVREGHDGTWVAHPALVAIAKQVFDEGMPTPNQLDRAARGRRRRRRRAARAAGRHAHRGRPAAQHPRRHPVPRGVAGRPGRRADLQPDGRRRHRRDLAHADLAVDQARRGAGRRPHRDAARWCSS